MSDDDAKPVCSENSELDQLEKEVVDDADEGSKPLQDMQANHRGMCKTSKECSELFEKLSTCNERVSSKTKTAETCLEELIDYVHCVDHCAAKRYFPLLK